MYFSYTVRGLQEQLGDYGHFMDSEDFCCEGNIYALRASELESGTWTGVNQAILVLAITRCIRINAVYSCVNYFGTWAKKPKVFPGSKLDPNLSGRASCEGGLGTETAKLERTGVE